MIEKKLIGRAYHQEQLVDCLDDDHPLQVDMSQHSTQLNEESN